MNLRKTLNVMTVPARYAFYTVALIPFFLLTCALIPFIRMKAAAKSKDARLVFGPSPVINNKYWSNSMKDAGYSSRTVMMSYAQTINKKLDFDEYVTDRLGKIPFILKLPLLFWESLFRFDVFVLSYDGWLLGSTFFWFIEPCLLKISGKKIVIIPYGGDAYVYGQVRSIPMLHGLMMSYPDAAKKQKSIARRVSMWTRAADCVNPGVMGIDGIGRWDVLLPSSLCIDTNKWQKSIRNSDANGINATVYVAHAPNHTGFKGTEFVIDAVNSLRAEGLKVELLLLQGIQNDEVCRIFHEESDILLEQLIGIGHGINAVEGMASGLPVMSNLDDENYTRIFRRWSYLNECPIVSVTPETVLNQLRKLVTSPETRRVLGNASRSYVEKYYGFDSSSYLFTNIVEYVYGERSSIINLYHPILGEYPRRLPPIDTSLLINNRIPD